jgi:solute carrier family 66, member 2
LAENYCDRIFYYPGARFDTALLVQAFLMIIVQVLLLKIALDYRPAPSSKGGEAAVPFAGAQIEGSAGAGWWDMKRPYNLWQWRSPKPYVHPLLSSSRSVIIK